LLQPSIDSGGSRNFTTSRRAATSAAPPQSSRDFQGVTLWKDDEKIQKMIAASRVAIAFRDNFRRDR
jgi:hypothetical protein